MEQPGFWFLIRRYTGLILALVILGAAVGAFMQLRQASGYVATTKLFSYSKQANNVQVSQTTSLAVQKMSSYVRLVGSTRLADGVVRELGLTTSSSVLAGRMSASLDKDTVIMTVTSSADTAAEAQAIAGVVPAQLTTLVNQLNGAAATDLGATAFTIIDGPVVANNNSLIRLGISILFGMLIGAALSMAIASVFVRRFVGRAPESLVAMTGVPVVGVIPSPESSGGRRGSTGPEEKRFAMASLRTAPQPVGEGTPSPLNSSDEARRLAQHRLARNLSHLSKGQHQLVVVCSPAGIPASGVTCMGLATVLAQRGQDVLLVDAGFGTEGAPFMTPKNLLGDVLGAIGGSVPLAQAVEKTSIINLSLLDLGSSHNEIVQAEGGRGLARVLDAARAHYDTVIVSAVPVLSPADIPTCVEYADVVLLVVDQYRTSPAETSDAVDGLRATSEASLGLVIDEAVRRSMSASQFEIGLVLPPSESIDDLFDPVDVSS